MGGLGGRLPVWFGGKGGLGVGGRSQAAFTVCVAGGNAGQPMGGSWEGDT